jgi:hypothetical protein
LEALERRLLLCSDFNGDGFDDLAIGAPTEDIGAVVDAGAVNVIYGSVAGLSAAAGPGDQLWSQDTVVAAVAIEDVAEAGDHFGASVAGGNFNGDAFCDLAIGVPDEDIGAVPNAGAVNVIYGSPGGLTPGGAGGIPLNQFWFQGDVVVGFPPIMDVAEPNDQFGFSVAAGNFNGDMAATGIDDLAIGVPLEDFPGVDNAGAVNVIYGLPGAVGLNPAGGAIPTNEFWHQGGPGAFDPLLDLIEAGDQFGFALAAGDFMPNGCEDLAVGAPYEDFAGALVDTGGVNVIYGLPTTIGLDPGSNQHWIQDPLEGVTFIGDRFGYSLAAGNFNGLTGDDLAIGVPFDDETVMPAGPAIPDAGAVNVIYSAFPAPGLLAVAGNQLWTQDRVMGGIAVEGMRAPGDRFGYALAAGRFGPDDHFDLAVGVPYDDETVAPAGPFIGDAGAVNVIYATAGLLDTPGNQLWTQDRVGAVAVVGVRAASDHFGFALAGGEYDGGPEWDLAVGVPDEDEVGAVNAGATNVIYACGGGILDPVCPAGAEINQLWSQAGAIEGSPEAGDRFGYALGAADSSTDGHDKFPKILTVEAAAPITPPTPIPGNPPRPAKTSVIAPPEDTAMAVTDRPETPMPRTVSMRHARSEFLRLGILDESPIDPTLPL